MFSFGLAQEYDLLLAVSALLPPVPACLAWGSIRYSSQSTGPRNRRPPSLPAHQVVPRLYSYPGGDRPTPIQPAASLPVRVYRHSWGTLRALAQPPLARSAQRPRWALIDPSSTLQPLLIANPITANLLTPSKLEDRALEKLLRSILLAVRRVQRYSRVLHILCLTDC